jgi:anti-sigma factor RsiW
MSHCERYQAQLLEYVYDLLEPGERITLQDHLGRCPACQAALGQAQRQKQVIGAAAKKEFAGVRFVAPTEPPAIPFKKKSTLSPHAVGRSWYRLALAASVLLALASLSGLGYKHGNKYLEAKRLVEDNRLALNDARSEQNRLARNCGSCP